MWKPVERGNRTSKQVRAAVWAAVAGAFVVGITTGNLLTGARPEVDWRISVIVLILGVFLTIRSAVVASQPAH